jgi:translation initiation factor 2 subunit 2
MESTHHENQEEDEVAIFDLSLKKKKKKKSESSEKEKEKPTESNEEEEDYSYVYLLDRLMNKLREDHPKLANKKKQVVVIPLAEVIRAGKRSIWANFAATCSIIRRPPEHVSAFIASELSTEISVNGQTQLVIKGKYNNKQIESIVTKYIVEYVTCSSCRQLDTTMTKDPITRILMVKCENCHTSRSKANISAHRKPTQSNSSVCSNVSNTPVVKTIS